LILHK